MPDGEERKGPVVYAPEEQDIDKILAEHIKTGINFDRYENIPVTVTPALKGSNVPESIQ